MTKKSKSTYELLFGTFKDMAREKDIEIKVETIRTDFEEAAIKAATKVFDVGIECCFFHLCQAHWRKIQDLVLRQTYIEDCILHELQNDVSPCFRSCVGCIQCILRVPSGASRSSFLCAELL